MRPGASLSDLDATLLRIEREEAAHAEGDEEYLALAEFLDSPVWTYDKDFRRVRGVKALSPSEVGRLAERANPSTAPT